MEIWSFTSPQNSPFLLKWRSHLESAIKKGFVPYCDSRTDSEKGSELKGRLPYLTTNLCWRLANFDSPDSCVIKESNFDSGPLTFLEKYDWDTGKVIRDLMKNNNVDVKGVPFLKFRGKEREGIIGMIERGDYNVEATLPRLLGLEEVSSSLNAVNSLLNSNTARFVRCPLSAQVGEEGEAR